jgi:hypothetical protein
MGRKFIIFLKELREPLQPSNRTVNIMSKIRAGDSKNKEGHSLLYSLIRRFAVAGKKNILI